MTNHCCRICKHSATTETVTRRLQLHLDAHASAAKNRCYIKTTVTKTACYCNELVHYIGVQVHS